MYRHFLKRVLDILLSGIGIVLLIPFWIVMFIAIKIDSRGPIFFKQKRIGIHKKTFSILKFRTMRTDTPHDMPTHMLENPEQYITKLGKFLRKTSLDELPQIFNIFVGQMSIIGPRPALWNQDDLIAERDKYGANDVRPGLTGWAQINGRDELEIEVKAKYDGEYVRRLSFWFDCKCFFGTIKSVIKHDGVVEGGTGELHKEQEEAEKKNEQTPLKLMYITNRAEVAKIATNAGVDRDDANAINDSTINFSARRSCMNYLVVVAHPDDETLGAGATICKLINEGNRVAVCILAANVTARANRSETLLDDEQKVFELLGVTKVYKADFPNIKMNTVPHIEIVQFIEKCIMDFSADAIITHHPSDTNNDHVITSYAVQAASRLFQRRDQVPCLKLLLYMEVPSSTEWSFDSSANRFTPNYFVEIGKQGVETKLKALSFYKGIMREYPHPRSNMAIEGLAVYRGVQAGCNYAEAFECVFWKD